MAERGRSIEGMFGEEKNERTSVYSQEGNPWVRLYTMPCVYSIYMIYTLVPGGYERRMPTDLWISHGG
jgi:hypothetical protein